MGMLFQGSALFDSMTVIENVLFPMEMFSSASHDKSYHRAMELLERVGLADAANKYPAEISGGMMKRTAIARALALNPKYLFCDEPNSGLDPKTSMVIDQLIYELTKEYNITTVVNTHDMNSVRSIGDKIIYLSADAFGVLPPVSILDDNQAQYHFLCGFTSKLAGTERGITEPQPSFSPAFGEAFLTLHPTMYAKRLVEKMNKHNAKAYLVNTGWNGTGKRISLKDTRAIIDAIIDGSIEKAETKHIPIMNLTIPVKLEKVSDILDPRKTYADAAEWETKAKKLAAMYIKNFEQYCDNDAAKALIPSGPQLD